MPKSFQFLAKLSVIVNFAIKGNDGVSVFSHDGLVA